MHFSYTGVGFHQFRQAALHHGFSLELIKFLQHRLFRPWHAGSFVRLARNACCFSLSHSRTGIHTVESKVKSGPVFSQNAGLLFAFGGELVIVAFEEGCLSVPDQEEAAHSSLKSRSQRISCAAIPCEYRACTNMFSELWLLFARFIFLVCVNSGHSCVAVCRSNQAIGVIAYGKPQHILAWG